MSELFDEAFFTRLSRLKLAAHMRLDQGQSGNRKSRARGSSVEFSDFREYLPGDDIRRIDWNAYGRLDRLYVKQFMEEKEAFYHILLDTSGSMKFGEKEKRVPALQLAAVFAWVAQTGLDRVEVCSCRAGRLDKLSPMTGRAGFHRLLTELENLEFSGETHLAAAVRSLSLNGRGICILISDFLDPEGVEEAVKYLIYRRQEVLLLQILCREEVAYTGEGTLALTDMETGEEVRVSMTRQTLETYEAAIKKHNENLEKLAKRCGARYLQVVSDENPDQMIFETMQKKGIFG